VQHAVNRRERQRQGVELAKASGKYKGRRPEPKTHERIIALRESGMMIARTATLAGCSIRQVERIWAIHKEILQNPKELKINDTRN